MLRIFVPAEGRVDVDTVVIKTVLDVPDKDFEKHFNTLTLTGLLVLESVKVFGRTVSKDGYGNPLCSFNARYLGKLFKDCLLGRSCPETNGVANYLLTLPESYPVIVFRGEDD